MSLPEHLGGQMAGNADTALIQRLIDDLNITSLLDIGCGDGRAAFLYADMGLTLSGVDGDWTRLPEGFIRHDFAQGPIDTPAADLAYSVEFLEHVEAQYVDNFMPSFARCQYAVVTAALPGQPGHHHVNCQPPEYWHEIFSSYGLEYDADYSKTLRQISDMRKVTGPRAGKRVKYFQRTGMFFRRC